MVGAACHTNVAVCAGSLTHCTVRHAVIVKAVIPKESPIYLCQLNCFGIEIRRICRKQGLLSRKLRCNYEQFVSSLLGSLAILVELQEQ